ncbi:MAG: hypothetical protein GY782_03220 [Gammaproteobacteria bacterium]|nr:hypothetical protein [Gammaproteobacteria bacterium]
MKFRELMKSLVPWPFRQTGRLKICAYCGLRASAFGFPWPAAIEKNTFYFVVPHSTLPSSRGAQTPSSRDPHPRRPAT